MGVVVHQQADAMQTFRMNRIKLFWVVLIGVGIACGATIGAVRGWGLTASSASSFSFFSSDSTSMTAESNRLPMLLMGDSNTEDGRNTGSNGWVGLLQSTNRDTVDLVNFGRSGDNTSNCIKDILPSVVTKLQSLDHQARPPLVTFWYGVNDAALANGRYAKKHLSLDKYKENLVFVVASLRQAAPNATILLITPPVVDDDKRRRVGLDNGAKPEDPLDRSNEQAGLYAAVCKQVAGQLAVQDHHVELLDLYVYFMNNYPQPKDRATFLQDGLHLSKAGHRVVFEEVQKIVDKLIPVVLLPSSTVANSTQEIFKY